MGKHCLPLFPFLLTPIFLICCFLLFLVSIQISPMLINNVLILHTHDAMCRVFLKIPFLDHVMLLLLEVSAMGWHKIHFMLQMSWMQTCVVGSLVKKMPKQGKCNYGDSKLFDFSTTQQTKHPMLLVKHQPPESLLQSLPLQQQMCQLLRSIHQ